MAPTTVPAKSSVRTRWKVGRRSALGTSDRCQQHVTDLRLLDGEWAATGTRTQAEEDHERGDHADDGRQIRPDVGEAVGVEQVVLNGV